MYKVHEMQNRTEQVIDWSETLNQTDGDFPKTLQRVFGVETAHLCHFGPQSQSFCQLPQLVDRNDGRYIRPVSLQHHRPVEVTPMSVTRTWKNRNGWKNEPTALTSRSNQWLILDLISMALHQFSISWRKFHIHISLERKCVFSCKVEGKFSLCSV